MAAHIHGPLYTERMGRTGPVMAFIHPNPMDQSSWLFQMAHMSTWFRCIAIDIPGYGRSPKADAGLTMADLAQGCWEAIDACGKGEPAIIVGSSVGSAIAPYMHHATPKRTLALVLAGFGYTPNKEFVARRKAGYKEAGLDYRCYTFDDFSAGFRTTPLAHFFADMFMERNATADVATILHQFDALQQPDPEGHFESIACPALILTGSEDNAHRSAAPLKDRIPGCELKVLPGQDMPARSSSPGCSTAC